MPSRRTHTKSRHGCLQCKTAHVKCNLLRPICGRCTKLDKGCSFPNLIPTHPLSSPPTVSPPNGTPLIPDLSRSSQSEVISWEDLELFHHYITDTQKTLGNREDLRQMWKIQVPQMAMKQKFLMHSIFSIAALHIASSHPDNESSYINRSIQHHNVALREYTSLLHNITPENRAALFICATLIVVVTLNIGVLRPQQELTGPIEDILGIFMLLRGIPLVVGEIWDWVKDSEIAPMFVGRDLDTDSISLPKDVADALRLLGERIQSLSDRDEKEIYTGAFEGVKEAFQVMSAVDYDRSMTLRWPIGLSQEYITRLSSRQPMALAILSYYAVILYDMREKWWAIGWGRPLIEKIYQMVDRDWKGIVGWPMKKVSEQNI